MANESNALKIAVEFIKAQEGLASNNPSTLNYVDKNATDNTNVYAYWDRFGKVWTIGWGSTYHPDGKSVKEGEVITKKKADEYISYEARKKMQAVKKLTDVSKLTDNQFAALISIAYNTGEGNLKYKGDIITAINRGDTSQRVAAIISESHITAKGKRVQGLVNRRKKESSLYLSGSNLPSQTKGKANLIIGILFLAVGVSFFLYKILNKE